MGITIPKEIEELGQLYQVEGQAVEFLAANSQLIPFLQNMAPVLAAYFPDAPLRLHLERDPETGREQELWAMGTWNGHWREGVERLDAFRRDWLNDRDLAVRHQLGVNFDYGPEQNP